MQSKNRVLTIAGATLLTIGILIGFVVAGAIIWGDLEASLFTSGIRADSRLGRLNCPVLITSNEVGTITATLKNPAQKDSDRYLIAAVSEGYTSLIREIKTKVPIAANSKQKVEWKIYPEDAAFDSVVLFRVYVNAKYPYPSMGANCGVIRIDVPFLTGKQIFALMVSMSVVTVSTGIVLTEKGIRDTNSKSRSKINAVYFLIGTLAVAAVLGYMGVWIFGIVALAIAVILTGLILFRRSA